MKTAKRNMIFALALLPIGVIMIAAAAPHALARTMASTPASHSVTTAAPAATPSPAASAGLHGSIKVIGDPSEAELARMAKISKSEAERIALKDLKARAEDKQVKDSELEVEDGFLVYSIEMTVKGRKGIDEILVDAGNGKILSREHEDEAKEIDEDTADEPDEADED